MSAPPHTYTFSPESRLRIAPCQGYSPNSVSPCLKLLVLTRPKELTELLFLPQVLMARCRRKTGLRQHTRPKPHGEEPLWN